MEEFLSREAEVTKLCINRLKVHICKKVLYVVKTLCVCVRIGTLTCESSKVTHKSVYTCVILVYVCGSFSVCL